MTHNNQEERSVEELLKKNAEYIENVSFGQYNDKEVNIGYKTLTQLIVEAHHHQLQKAREEAWITAESVIEQEARWCKTNGKTKGELDFLKGVEQALWLVQKAKAMDYSELDQDVSK